MGCTTPQMPKAEPGRRDTTRGFTLVELLISVAIFVTVIASVTLLFNAAIRASKQGFQNQEAFEVARGAMDILERDLSRGFTRSDLGDVFNFYGTPIGFTYVGMIPEDNSNRLNMARVTYVMYHDPDAVSGALDTFFDASAIDPTTGDALRVPTYGLLRYVEPGVSDLDSYPVDWDQALTTDDFTVTLQDEIDLFVDAAAATACNESDPSIEEDALCRENLDRAFKRQYWVQMLSGGDPDDLIPNAWTDLPAFTDDNLNPLDYIVAENIQHVFFAPVLAGNSVDDDLDEAVDEPDEAVVTLDCFPQLGDLTADCLDSGFLETPNFNPAQPGRLPFFTYTTYVDVDEVGTSRTVVAPITLRYWNDELNVFFDGINNDDDITTSDDAGDPLLQEVNLGSPLAAIIPASVNVDFRLFFPSPYPGAPDFKERFTQRIDLISGYRRATPKLPDGS